MKVMLLRTLTLAVATAVPLPWQQVISNGLSREPDPIYIAGIFDLPWADELMEFVFASLNNRTDGWHDDVLPGRTFEYTLEDSLCDKKTALDAYWRARAVRRPHGILGAGCSGPSIVVNHAAGSENIVQVSGSPTSPELSDKRSHGTFVRTVAPDNEDGEVGATVALLESLNWDRVTVLGTDTAFSKGVVTSFRDQWIRQGNEIGHSSTILLDEQGQVDRESAQQVLANVPTDDPSVNSRVILLAAHATDAFDILEIASEMDFQKDTVWIGFAWVGGALPDRRSWLPSQPGYLGVSPYRNRDEHYGEFMSLMQEYQASRGREPWENLDGHYSQRYFVDAILSLVLGLSKVPISEQYNGTRVAAAIRTLSIPGVSGQLEFTDKGDRRNPMYSIMNLQRGQAGSFQWVEVGSTGVHSNTTEFNIKRFCFAERGCGINGPPSATYPEPVDEWETWVLAAIAIGLLLFIAVLADYWRSKCKIQQLQEIDTELSGIDNTGERQKERAQELLSRRAALQDVPGTWTKGATESLVEVAPHQEEYWTVAHHLQRDMGNAHISKLWRVQNPFLWSFYNFHKKRLAAHDIDLKETDAWHGTSKVEPSVIYGDKQDGFMMQYSRVGMWGRGIYFAAKSVYSNAYAFLVEKTLGRGGENVPPGPGEREMFLTKVLVGNAVKLDPDNSLTAPPQMNPTLKYNTVTGNTQGSEVWIVYENGRAYPEYLVRYYRGARDAKRTPFGTKQQAKQAVSRCSTWFPFRLVPDWQFRGDDDQFTSYDTNSQGALENAYLNHLTGGSSQTTLRTSGYTYKIDFDEMGQTNELSQTVRKIRRRTKRKS